MNDLNEIAVMKTDNCIIHICDNSIGTEEEQKKCWQEFSKKAYELCTINKQNMEN